MKRKVFYVDVGDMAPEDIAEYMKNIRDSLSASMQSDEELLFAPLRPSTVESILKSPRRMKIIHEKAGYQYDYGKEVLCLGEVTNAPGFAAIVTSDHKVYEVPTYILEEITEEK